MIKNPHLVCERVLNTLKVSGLTYSLSETPFSCNIELRKKYVKNFVPQPDFNVLNYEFNSTATTTATKQESAIKSEQDTVKELWAVRNSLLHSQNETINLRETLGQLQCSSLAREKSLISESSNVKEEASAEIEKCSIMKSRYDQLVLASELSLARERDLTSELLSVKEELTAEIEKSSMMKSRYDQLALTSESSLAREGDITTELLNVKEELTAGIKKTSTLKIRYDQLVLSKAEMAAERTAETLNLE